TPAPIAVIDIGKTNAKVVLIAGSGGQQIASRSLANVVRQDGPYPHADTERLWDFMVDALAALAEEHGIGGIAITTHGATAALTAGDELALPVLDYEHDGPEAVAAAYRAARPDFSESLSPALPDGLNLGAQIFW